MSTRKKNVRKAAKLGALAALTIVCPPAGAVAAGAGVLRSSRRYAQSGDPKDALGMVTGYDTLSGDHGGSRRK